jgi:hypothetical protein
MSLLDGDFSSTVDVESIAEHVGDPEVRLVEIDVSRVAFDEGHIPGAVLWNAYADLRDENYKPVGWGSLSVCSHALAFRLRRAWLFTATALRSVSGC